MLSYGQAFDGLMLSIGQLATARSNTHDARTNTHDARTNTHDARSDL